MSKSNKNMEKKEFTTDEILKIFTKNVKYHDRPIAVITMGIPGSGKSTVVKKIIQKNMNKILPSTQPYLLKDFVNCNPDEILPFIEETDEKIRLSKASRKNGSLLKKIRESDNKYSVIYDGTGVNLSAYKGNINKFIENGYFTVLIYVKTNPLIAKNRVKRRSRKVKSSNIKRIYEDLNQPIKGKNMKKFDFYKNDVAVKNFKS